MIVTRFAPSPTGLLHLGHALAAISAELKSGKDRDAEATLSEADRLENAPLAVYFNRGSLFMQRALGKPIQSLEPAIADMRRVVATTPNSGEPYLNLAVLLAQRAKMLNSQDKEVEPLLDAALRRGMSLKFATGISQLAPYVSQSRLAEVAASEDEDLSRYVFKRVIAPW